MGKDITEFFDEWKKYGPDDDGVFATGSYVPGNNEESDRSYCFSINSQKQNELNDENIQKILEAFFGLDFSNDDAKKALKEALHGNGNEAKRFTTFHSSSLCAFMHFLGIDEKHPIDIPINDNKSMKFNKAYFEYKNIVTGGYPSNVDVVLESKEAILFLECKFSEYLKNQRGEFRVGKNADNEYAKVINQLIKQNYDNETDTLFVGKDKNKRLTNVNKDIVETKTEKTDDGEEKETNFVYLDGDGRKRKKPYYLAGIKQMIAHYIGVKNFIKNNKYSNYCEDDRRKCLNAQGKDVYLGTIVFKFNKEFDNESRRLEAYRKDYKTLIKKLNEIKIEDKIEDKIYFINDLLTYQDNFSTKNLPGKVSTYYKYPKE